MTPTTSLKLLAVWSLLAALTGCNSQSAPPARPTDTAAAADLKTSVYYLASDQLEGRGVGSAGLEKAAHYISGTFRRLGLKPLPDQDQYFQNLEMTTATAVGKASKLVVDGKNLAPDQEFQPTSFSSEGEFAGPVAFVGYGISSEPFKYDDYAGIDVKGKVALALRFEPHDEKGKSAFTHGEWSDEAPLIRKAQVAAEHGAAALLLVNPPMHHGQDAMMPFARQFQGMRSPIPFIQISQEAADALLQRAGAKDLRSLQQEIDGARKPQSFVAERVNVSGNVQIERNVRQVRNVLACLPGSGPRADEYVVVGAHYDHVGRGEIGSLDPGGREIHNGADDNASGTAALLAIAGRLAQEGSRDRSIIFVAFTAEEWGLIGSQYFVEHPPVPLEKIVAMLNLDMVGRVRNNTVTVSGSSTAEAFAEIVKRADDATPLVVKDVGRGGIAPSDHMAFALKRIPVLFFFSGVHEDYHRPTDDAPKINFAALDQVVDAAVNIVKDLAQIERPQFVESHGSSPFMAAAGGSTGSRAALGVVPDYATDEAHGVKISGTVPGSPAAGAGLKSGDIIVKVGDRKIDTLYDLSAVLAESQPGDKVTLEFRRGETILRAQAVLAERKG